MLLAAVVLSASAVQAQTDADPPGVAGRLSYMNGPVSLQPGGVNDWVDATVNRPLTTSDRVWADQGGRAEVSMGNVTARIDQETSMTITNLDDSITQLELDQGSLFIHVRRLFDGESVEIDTPNVAFVLDREGDYRFDVDPNNDTTYVSVRKGEGEGTGEASGVRVSSGQQVVFSGGNSGQNQMAELGDPDDFDNWNMQRDDHADRSASAQYVSPGMVGYEDLDDYGAWQQDQQYGPVWRPRVEAGWAPYHSGHWAWIDPWGYTWVDDSPWGYAPFHYGRWVYAGGGWGWAPGPPAVYRPGIAYVRPVYSPALVAFVGGAGIGVGVAVGGGPVGWVPLGWGEPYYPSYRVSERYVRNVNVTNTRIVNITNVTNNYTVINRNNTTVINNVTYVNQRAPGGVTAVPASAMASGRPVAQAAVRVDQRQMQQARFMAAPGVAPQKEAVLGGRTPATQHTPPRTVQRPVMTQHAPPPPPTQFAAKQQLLQKNNGRPLEASQVQSLPKVERPAPMKAGQPRPAAAVQQLNADKPKGGAQGPAFRPAPTKGGPAGPANAARPNGPAQPAARPNTPPQPPANAGRPNNPPNSPNGPGNAPRPGTPADNAARPGTNATPANNVPRPPNASTPANQPARNATPPQPNTPRPAEPATRNNEPATANPPAHNVPRPPTRDNTPNTPNTPNNPGNAPARTAQPTYENRNAQPATPPRPPANDSRPAQPTYENRNAQPATPPRPAPETRTAEPPNPPRNAAPANQPRTPQPPANESRPAAHDNNVPRPPEHQAAPPRSNPPAAKENKESKAPKEDKKDEKPHR